jgi:uncharacterized protein YjbI with pentapeptide repeats
MVRFTYANPLKVLGNPEHVELVKRGSTAIKRWRKCNPDVQLDLRGADLRGISLAGANLSGASLGAGAPDESRANLSNAALRKAHIRNAYFRWADLRGADLRQADLSGSQLSIVDFSFAKLSGANLSKTILIVADFHRAEIGDLDFTAAKVGGTRFTMLDLSKARGLSTVEHTSPSTIDIDTLLAFGNTLSESFLLGCGVPDVLISYLPSLVGSMSPVQFDSCFISFSYADESFAKRLHSRLRDAGVRVWFAPKDVQGGRKLHDQLDKAIQVHDRLLLVLSDASMKSQWVQTELRRALAAETSQRRRKLFPIRLCDMASLRRWTCFDADTGRDMAVEVRGYFVPDFSDWRDHDAFEAGFKRLLRDLKATATRDNRRA